MFQRLFIMVFVLLICTCDYIYEPEQMQQSSVNNGSSSVNNGVIVYPIDGKRQTCNPSISQDTTIFSGCMLWLNFSGELKVVIPSGISGFSKNANQHDRLLITDTSNIVKWFIPIKHFADESEEFQDPEWSSHPHYISFMVSSSYKKKWSGYAINLLTKDTIRLCKEKLNETSTPFIWVESGRYNGALHGDSITYDTTTGMINKKSVREFFGTENVKYAYAIKQNGILSLYYVDFSSDEKPVKLLKPVELANWDFESPIISPDGKWVTYNAYLSTDNYSSYIQELRPDAVPILIQEQASDPHWFTIKNNQNSKLFIIYSVIPGSNLVLGDLTNKTVLETGSEGITKIQNIECYSGLPSLFSFKKIGDPEIIVKLPLKGGISPDAKFLCTGSDKAYIVRLMN